MIWTSMVKGNVPVSLVTVTLDTIIAPVLLPVFILLMAGVAISINYSKMVVDLLLMITAPSIIGMLLYDSTAGRTKVFAQGAGGILSKLSFFVVIYISAAFVIPHNCLESLDSKNSNRNFPSCCNRLYYRLHRQ